MDRLCIIGVACNLPSKSPSSTSTVKGFENLSKGKKDSGIYLMYWLSLLGGRDAILHIASSISGLYTLSTLKVARLPIPLPPIEERVEIRNILSLKLSSIEYLENEVGVQLLKTESNEQSCLVSAFSGALYHE